MKMKHEINCIDLVQYTPDKTTPYYFQTLWIQRGQPGNDSGNSYHAHTPARFARFLSIVLAFAARHDEERRHADS